MNDKETLNTIIKKLGDLPLDELETAIQGAMIISLLPEEDRKIVEDFIILGKRKSYERGKNGEPFK